MSACRLRIPKTNWDTWRELSTPRLPVLRRLSTSYGGSPQMPRTNCVRHSRQFEVLAKWPSKLPNPRLSTADVIGSMLEETDRLTRLVDSLLTLSRADAGHIHVQRTDISLLGLAQEASSLVEVLAEEKQQRISVEGVPTLIVSGDRLILRQALINLIDNAIKYSPAEAEILVRVAAGKDNHLIVEVVDQG